LISYEDISITYYARVTEYLPWLSRMQSRSFLHMFGLSVCILFSTSSHKRPDFWKKKIEYEICGFIFSTDLSEMFVILRSIKQDMIIKLHRSSCTVNFRYFCRILMTNFLNKLSKNPKITNFTKIHPVGSSCCMRTDGRIDRYDETNRRFKTFYLRS
jgi:hypothetical protein